MSEYLILDVSELLQEMLDEIPGWAFYAASNPAYPIALVRAYYWYLYEGSPDIEYTLAAMLDHALRKEVYEFLVERSFSLVKYKDKLGWGTELHEAVMKHDLDNYLMMAVTSVGNRSVKLEFEPFEASEE